MLSGQFVVDRPSSTFDGRLHTSSYQHYCGRRIRVSAGQVVMSWYKGYVLTLIHNDTTYAMTDNTLTLCQPITHECVMVSP